MILTERLVEMIMQSVWKDDAVVLECTQATENTAEVRNQTLTEVKDKTPEQNIRGVFLSCYTLTSLFFYSSLYVLLELETDY